MRLVDCAACPTHRRRSLLRVRLHPWSRVVTPRGSGMRHGAGYRAAVWTRFVSALEHRPPPSEPSARQAVDPALAVLAEELAAGVRPPVTSPLRHPLPKRVAT